MKDIKTILLTTDLSDTSEKAVAPALTIARKFDAKIVLAHVVDLMPPYLVGNTAIDLSDLEGRQRGMAHEQLARFAEKALGRDVEVETVVLLGVPHMEIVSLAQGRKVDVIVMATHGRGFVSRLLVGSTTERVIRHAPCPVLVVPDPQAKS